MIGLVFSTLFKIFQIIFQILALFFGQNVTQFGPVAPPNFPSEIYWNITDFENWSQDYTYKCLYTAWPTNEDQVLTLANWALENQFTMRASGVMHGYSALTVDDHPEPFSLFSLLLSFFPCFSTPSCMPPNILLVKTLELNQMQVISNKTGSSSFWAQPGISLSKVLERLEQSNLGILNFPSIGSITFGGAMTIGGHGTGVPTNASNPTKAPGHTYGSMSNLIMEVRVVAYDSASSKFVLKTIPRTDPAMQGILVNLGRTFVTNYTVRAGPLLNMRCRSYTDIYADELFAHPTQSSGKRTISHYLDTTGMVETILFAFTDKPWTKVWEIAPTQPAGSRRVTTTNNYPFVDNFPTPVSNIIADTAYIPASPQIAGLFEYGATVTDLVATNAYDLWGTSRTVLLYIENPLRWTEDGYGILTTRGNVQLVVNMVWEIYQQLLSVYSIYGPFQVRVTGIDNPADVLIPGAQVPGMGPSSPSKENPNFDTVVWVNFLTFTGTPDYIEFKVAMQTALIAAFKPPLALLRTEWSKGFGYSAGSNDPGTNVDVIQNSFLPNQYDFPAAKNALNNTDPMNVFKNSLLTLIFG